MKRKLRLLNVVLVALIALVAWRIQAVYQEAQARQAATFGSSPALQQVAPVTGPQAPQPLRPMDYLTVAERFLFAPDRIPTVEIAPPAEPVLPTLPTAHGVLDFGTGPTVILTKPGDDKQTGYRVGDEVGGFKLVEITPTEVALQWEGGVLRRTIAELRDIEPAAAPVARTPQRPGATPAAEAPKTTVLAAPATAKGPSEIEMAPGMRACQQNDSSPPGTVVGKFKKVVTRSPFGAACRWEEIQ